MAPVSSALIFLLTAMFTAVQAVADEPGDLYSCFEHRPDNA